MLYRGYAGMVRGESRIDLHCYNTIVHPWLCEPKLRTILVVRDIGPWPYRYIIYLLVPYNRRVSLCFRTSSSLWVYLFVSIPALYSEFYIRVSLCFRTRFLLWVYNIHVYEYIFVSGPAFYSEYVAGFKNAILSIESQEDKARYHHGVTGKYSNIYWSTQNVFPPAYQCGV